MKEFIELTKLDGEKMLQPLKNILYVCLESNGVFVCTQFYRGREWGYYVKESYEEIKAQLLG